MAVRAEQAVQGALPPLTPCAPPACSSTRNHRLRGLRACTYAPELLVLRFAAVQVMASVDNEEKLFEPERAKKAREKKQAKAR